MTIAKFDRTTRWGGTAVHIDLAQVLFVEQSAEGRITVYFAGGATVDLAATLDSFVAQWQASKVAVYPI